MFMQRLDHRDPGIVHENIDTAEGIDRRSREFSRGFFLSHIAAHVSHSTGGGQAAQRLGLFRDIDRHDSLRFGLGVFQDDRQADSRRGPGHDRRLAC